MRIRRRPFLTPSAPIRGLVVLGLIGTALSFITSAQQAVQLASVMCLVGAAALALALRRVRPLALGAYELMMMGLALVSAFISALVGYYNASAYSFVLFVCVVSSALVVRSLSLRELFGCFVAVSTLLVLLPLALYPSQLTTALSLSISNSGLERFTPFGMHPNLVGFIYSGTAILLAGRCMLARRRLGKLFFLALAVLSLVFVVGASARSALLGVGVAGIFYVWAAVFARGGDRKRRLAFVLGIVALAIAALSIDPARDYLLRALEVQSDTRGVGSGGSGRLEIWQAGIDLLLSQPGRMLLGYGFRSADPEIIGFPVESSYINLCLEVGLVGATLVIGFYLFSALRMIAIGKSQAYGEDGTVYLFFGLATLCFMMHSVFNRYLVGIGNPMALISLLIMVSFSVRFRPQRRSVRRYATPPRETPT